MKKSLIAPWVSVVLSVFLVIFACAAYAETVVTKTPVAQGPLRQVNDYFRTQTTTYSDGKSIERQTISGPPRPPAGYELQRRAVSLPSSSPKTGTKTLTVPAYQWVFGCSAVSGSMIAAYYDRNGYPNVYTGPTGSGLMPLTEDSSWGTWTDGTDHYPNNPLIASRNGLDGRVTKGSIDDYWILYGSEADDPYITGSWTQHTWGDAVGDYMKTSQSGYDNTDGSTNFYNFGSATKLTCADMAGYDVDTLDGTYGRKLFYEARGYTVTDCYNQKTDNQYAGGFSFAQYKAEIDAGRPVFLNLDGHSIVGVGYDDSTSTVYIHDTWDNDGHTMTWGGSYGGMELLSVSVVSLTANTATETLTATIVGNGSLSATSLTCSGSTCTGSYAQNTTVTITAIPNTGYALSGWTGDCDSKTATTCTVTMTSAKAVTATFTNPCAYVISPSAPKTFTSKAGTANIAVTGTGPTKTFSCIAPTVTPSDSSWISAATTKSWAANKETVTVSVTANPNSTDRPGSVAFADKTLVITQKGATCAITALTPASQPVPVEGGSYSFSVTVSAQDCAWTAASNKTWIALGTASGVGNGTVTYTVPLNTTEKNQNGAVTVTLGKNSAKKTQAVAQKGVACAITAFAPTSQPVPVGGGSYSFDVTVSPQYCAWTAASNKTWITVDAGSGVGNGTVSYTAAANTTTKTQIGAVTVTLTNKKKKAFTVTESGS
jgi:hypothetical protein